MAQNTNRDFYDMNEKRPFDSKGATPRDTREASMTEFLAEGQRKAALGAAYAPNWQMVNKFMKERMTANGDWWKNSRLDLDAVLRNVDGPSVLLYAVS